MAAPLFFVLKALAATLAFFLNHTAGLQVQVLVLPVFFPFLNLKGNPAKRL